MPLVVISGSVGMYTYIILFNFNLISNLNLLKAFIKMITISKDKPFFVSFTILALEIDVRMFGNFSKLNS